MNQSHKINISDLDKTTLLTELWKNAKLATIFEITDLVAPRLNIEEIKSAIKYNGCDYISGRPIKVTFRKNMINVSTYNKYNGENLGEKVIENIRLNLL
jgi:hypothetical protein